MGHCSCGAHSCATEKKVDAKVSNFHEYGKVIFSLLLLAGGIIMNALDLAFFREGYVSLIWYIGNRRSGLYIKCRKFLA